MTTPCLTPHPLLLGTPPCHALERAPEGATVARVLMLPPLFEEQRCAHRALQAVAVALASAGARVLQVEPFATGNSAGRLTDISLSRWTDDIHATMAYLALHGDAPLTILACRAGALLAARALADGLATGRLLLLQPVTNGKEYLRQTRTRRMIQDKMTGDPPPTHPCEIEGQVLSEALLADLEALRLPDTPPAPGIRLIQCSFNEKPLKEFSDLLARWSLPAESLRPLVQEPFWLPHSPGRYESLAATLVEEVTA